MRTVRFATGAGASYGEEAGGVIHELAGPPWAGADRTGRMFPVGDVRLLAPCVPSKVLAVGRNFASHLHGRDAPAEPGIFTKLPTSIIGPGDDIVLPPGAEDVHYEGELVIVIGRETSRVDTADAAASIFGVTAGNDISERRWQRDDLQWLRAKGADTFGPLGPAIETGLDHGDLLIRTRHNGAVVQSERTRDLIFPLEEIVSFVSTFVTLVPGDVIYSGTPGSTSAIAPGDVIEIELEGVGVLRNGVVAG
ncbi:MAG: fumarylacetoacetate hydrolase family protein [Gemmatimonadota bacterium]|nr:fumarylacetoacetate hydrolase family protein [Gemmatimonadota bacterium]